MSKRFNDSDLTYFGGEAVQPGTLLVASHALTNTPFEKTVLLVLQSSEEGTYGVVLNRPGNEQLRSTWFEMTGANDGAQSILQGGPIGGPVFALHREQGLAEVEVPGGLFVSSSSETVREIAKNTEREFKIVFGIAGWQRGQLNQEVESGYWLKLDGNSEQVFEDADWMWEKSLRRYGNQKLCQVVGLTGMPANPLLN